VLEIILSIYRKVKLHYLDESTYCKVLLNWKKQLRKH